MSEPVATLVPLAEVAEETVGDLLDLAFGADRQARTAYRVREGAQWLPALSFAVLGEDDTLAGTIQTWPIALIQAGGWATPLLMIGPVAVAPARQGQGFGRGLFAALDAALAAGARAGASPLPQVLIGDPEYYGRFGFAATHTAGWLLPSPGEQHRLLARAANPAVLPREGMLGPWRG